MQIKQKEFQKNLPVTENRRVNKGQEVKRNLGKEELENMINETGTSNSMNALFDPKFDNKSDNRPDTRIATKPAGNLNISKDSNDSYESVMKNAIDGNKKAPVKTTAAKLQKLDKPKIGNREPFFPEQPMPYHPEEKSVEAEPNQQPIQQMDDENRNVESAKGKDHFFDDELIQRIVKQKDSHDDQQGVMKQVFDSSVVSYPVRQIASESIDDDVKKSLMAQGLWDVQGMYVAKPSQAFANVMEMNQDVVVPVQKPIAQFMVSMENELGVSPDRLVQAYSELTPGQLQKQILFYMKRITIN